MQVRLNTINRDSDDRYMLAHVRFAEGARDSTTTSNEMTAETLTALLAERVMKWSTAPDRFLMGKRRWIPRWRFQPLTSLEDAFRLLESAASSYTLYGSSDATFTAEVCAAGRTGSASGQSKATTITVAVARAIGIQVDLPAEQI